MHHEHSVFFRIFNDLLTRLLGPVDGVHSWWTDGITIGSAHIAGVAPRGEHGELQGWIPDHVAMAFVVFLFCAIVFPLLKRGYKKDVPGHAQNVVELFVDFLRGLIKENIPDHGEKYLPIVGG